MVEASARVVKAKAKVKAKRDRMLPLSLPRLLQLHPQLPVVVTEATLATAMLLS